MKCPATNSQCQSACTHPALGGFCSILFSREAWEEVQDFNRKENDMLEWKMLHPKMTMEHLGFIPFWLHENDPRDAREQLNAGYVFGGWSPFQGWTKLGDDNTLYYPGDPPLKPLAMTELRGELIVFYDHAWVAVIQPDRSFEVCRMD